MSAPSIPPDRVDIVVPVLNEEGSIGPLFERVAAIGYASSLVFVDNASSDGTVERIEQLPGVRLVRHARNEGWGASLRDGVAAGSAPFVILLDADLEYPPEVIPGMLELLQRESLVYGSRFLDARGLQMSALRVAGNRAVTAAFDLLLGQRTTDCLTGLKGFRREALPFEVLRETDWRHLVELGVLATCRGVRIVDVPLVYAPRDRGESKMRHFRVAAELLACLVRLWWRHVVLRRPMAAVPPGPRATPTAD